MLHVKLSFQLLSPLYILRCYCKIFYVIYHFLRSMDRLLKTSEYMEEVHEPPLKRAKTTTVCTLFVMLNGNRFLNLKTGFLIFSFFGTSIRKSDVPRRKQHLNVTVNVICCLVKVVDTLNFMLLVYYNYENKGIYIYLSLSSVVYLFS